MFAILKRNKEITAYVLMLVTAVSFGISVRTTAGEALKKVDQLEALAKQNTTTQAMLAVMVRENSTRLKAYLETMGFDRVKAREWAYMPREPKVDSAGAIEPAQSWLVLAEDIAVGVEMKVDDSGRVLIDTLWDVRGDK